MKTTNLTSTTRDDIKKPVIAISVSIAIWLLISFYDALVLGFNMIREVPPIYSAYYLGRSVLAVGLSWWIASSLPWRSFPTTPSPGDGTARRIGAVSALLSILVLLLFLFSPEKLTRFGREDALVEWLSFLGLFAAALLFLFSALNLRLRLTGARWSRLYLFGLAAGCFVVAMEEVSWFQRVLEVETPEVFAGNGQGETNFHNYITNESEVIYYSLSALVLCCVPFIAACLSDKNWLMGPPFLPGLAAAFSCISMNALNWDMWNTILFQILLWTSVFLLVKLAQHARAFRAIALLLTLVMLVSQACYLAWGHTMLREHDLTEYREGFIALGFFIYACQTMHATRRA